VTTLEGASRTAPIGLERPPGAIFLTATCVAAGIALEASSRDNLLGWTVAIIAWLGVFTAWLVRLVFLAAPQARTFPGRWRLRWALPMLILAGAAALMVLDVPLRLRFEASRPALDQLAAEVMAGSTSTPDSAGLYDLESLTRTPDGVRFLVEGSGFIDRFGFAFAADGDPSDPDSDDVYRPLGGGWFVWISVF
jgi:hypothetical protein